MIKVIKKQTAPEEDSKEKEAKKIISRMRHQSEEEQAAAFAQAIGIPYIDTNLFPVGTEDIKALTEEEARRFGVAVIRKAGKKITLISMDPTQPATLAFIQSLKDERGWNVKVFVASKYNVEKTWEKYKQVVFVDVLEQLSVSVSAEGVEKFEKELEDLKNLKQRITELSTTQIMSIIMAGAYKLGASDVHMEPQEDLLRLRYRIDGVLHDVVELPLSVFKSLITRIKMMSGMKINLRDIAQDGKFEIHIAEKEIDVRASIIPGNYGESAVMRLLDPASLQTDFENLGLRGRAYEIIRKEMEAPNGMLLTTGPTGSGKTTTLYSIINRLNNPETKIITIEDPIEYRVKGISQTQVEKDRGYTFAAGLRSIVRQDPDVILVGEIRDDETADIAVNSALTGHLVLSTLHTNDAIGAIPRFLELGVKPSLLPASINAIIGQRLVRRLCDCKEEYVPAKESLESINKVLSIISPKAKVEIPKEITKLYRPKGCPKCNNLGYKGRVGIFEVLTIDSPMEKLVLEMAGKSELMVAALESGMITMMQDGILKAVEGITSIDEVKRTVGEGEFLEEIYSQLMSQSLSRKVSISKEIYQKTRENSDDPQKIQALLKESASINLNKIILASGIILKAGDIHLEPGPQSVKVRFRIDGILQDIAELPLKEYPAILGEIKIMSGIKTEVREGVVDSRFAIEVDEGLEGIEPKKTDVRVSIILGGYGETAVLRILSQTATALDIKNLNIRKQNLDKILEQIKKPNGIFLNTGPTGSGKTTTLYSILKLLNKSDTKIITVEDPIEYQLEGILQTAVNDKGGYTFATALRSLLRQNPNIIMIGEIRDNETAQIAVESALTGHLILSTLHTNNAAGSIQRLSNMGVSPADLAESVNAFMAQRLVRKLCDCKEKVAISPEDKERLEKVLKTVSPKSGVEIPKVEFFYKAKGCEKCNHLGYQGRITISEVLVLDKDVKALLSQGASSTEIQNKAVENGMITMTQDGVLKVLEGETTLEEVERTTEV